MRCLVEASHARIAVGELRDFVGGDPSAPRIRLGMIAWIVLGFVILSRRLCAVDQKPSFPEADDRELRLPAAVGCVAFLEIVGRGQVPRILPFTFGSARTFRPFGALSSDQPRRSQAMVLAARDLALASNSAFKAS